MTCLVCLQPGPDVRVPGEGRHGDGGGAEAGQVVAVAPVQRQRAPEPATLLALVRSS